MMEVIFYAALRSLALASIVFVSLALLRVRHPKVRKAAWASVVLCAFLMPVVGGRGPYLNEQVLSRLSDLVRTGQEQSRIALLEATRVGRAELTAKKVFQTGTQIVPWHLLGGIYLVGVLILLARLCLGLIRAALIWKRAQPLELVESAAVRISEKVLSPWTFGNGILLPREAVKWHTAKLSLVLSHERTHVEQADFFLQLAVRLYTALFWFSPLGWLLHGECARLGEQTSDYSALQGSTDPLTYAELLIGFSHTSYPSVAVTMARKSGISHRIHLILKQEDLMNHFRSPLRASLLAAVVVLSAVLIATLSMEPKGICAFGNVINGDTLIVGSRRGCKCDIGMGGSLTVARFNAIKANVGGSFVAYSEGGHNFVINDTKMADEALGLYKNYEPNEARQVEIQHKLGELVAVAKHTGKAKLVSF